MDEKNILRLHCPYRHLIKINKFGQSIYKCNCYKYKQLVNCKYRFCQTCHLGDRKDYA